MTTHEFDAYCDTQPLQEPPYHEDLLLAEMHRDFTEMEIEKEANLKRQGAKEALDELKLFLLISGNDERCKEEIWGLKWSIDAINRRLTNLEVTQEGGIL